MIMKKLFISFLAMLLLFCTACQRQTTTKNNSSEATMATSEVTVSATTHSVAENVTSSENPTQSVTDESPKPSSPTRPSVSTATSTISTVTEKPSFTWEGKYVKLNSKKAEISLNADSMDKSAQNVTFTLGTDTEAALNLVNAYPDQFNYYSIQFTSTQPLWIYIGYEKGGKLYEELCFLDASTETSIFNSYIDGFMDGNVASNFKSIRFDNRGDETATVEIVALAVVKKESIDSYIYLSNDYIKIGADLVYGGALAYLSYIKEPVALVQIDGRAEVGIGYADMVDAHSIMSTEVNLLNNYDPGRLVQQSYYGTSGTNDDYEPGNFMGRVWNYNPVMGGDRALNHSKIIDFELTKEHIYVKCRPMDWGKENSPTLSYMESTYSLDNRNLIVDNRFVDYSGYNHGLANQELPAFYVIEPLYRLAYYEGNDVWTGDKLTYKDDLPFWDGVWTKFKSRENWWAWVNGADDGFGLGLYVPEVTEVIGGMYQHDGTIKNDPSKSNPTSYIAPLRTMAIKNYKPIEYSYAIVCGRLSEIRQSISEMKANKTINNMALRRY